MATFKWGEDYVCEELIGAKAWAYWCWAKENQANMFGSMYERSTDGYVAAERDLILKRKRK